MVSLKSYSRNNKLIVKLADSDFSEEDIQQLFQWLEAMEVPVNLYKVRTAISRILEAFDVVIETLYSLTEPYDECYKTFRESRDFLLRVINCLGNETGLLSDSFHGYIKEHPIFVMLCLDPSPTLDEEHKRYLLIFASFLVMSSWYSVKSLTRSGQLNFYADNANSLRQYLTRKKGSTRKLKSLTQITSEEFVRRLFDCQRTTFKKLQLKLCREIESFLQTGAFSTRVVKSFDDKADQADDLASPDGQSPDNSELQTSFEIFLPSAGEQELAFGGSGRRRRKKQWLHVNKEDEEPAFIDSVEVESEAEGEAQITEVECTAIYGSRLDVYERQQQQSNSNVLTPLERTVLVEFLHSSSDKDQCLPAIAYLFFTLTSAKPSDYVQNIPIVRVNVSNNIECISLTKGCWVRRDVKLEKAFQPEPKQLAFLERHSSLLALPLPKHLLLILKQLCNQYASEKLSLRQLLRSNGGAVRECLRKLNQDQRLHRPITEAAIRNCVFNELSLLRSAGEAALTLANTEYFNPSHLYYLSLEQSKLRTAYSDVLETFNMEVECEQTTKGVYSGSQLLILPSYMNRALQKLYLKIAEFGEYQSKTPEQLIAHHNTFAAYTGLLLIINTGHRVRSEYAFEYLTIDIDSRMIFVADKLHFAESAIRYIPLTEIVAQQLLSYLAHLRTIAKYLNAYSHELACQMAANSLIYSNTLCSLLGFIEDKKWVSLGTRHLSQELGDAWSFPLNGFRHYFCSTLHQVGAGDSAPLLMGHVSKGEAISDNFCVSTKNSLQPHSESIGKLLEAVGGKLHQVSMPRGKRINIPAHFVSKSGPYTPDYLMKYQSRHNEAKILAKRVIASCTKELGADKLTPDEFAKLCKQRIMQDEVGTRLQQIATAAMAHCNRIIQRYSRIKRLNFSKFSYLEEPANVDIRADELYASRSANLIRKRLSDGILICCHKQEASIEVVVLSMLIHRFVDVLSDVGNASITEFRFQSMGTFVLCQVSAKTKQCCYLLDSVTSLYVLNQFKLDHQYEVEQLNKKVKRRFADLVTLTEADDINREHDAVSALTNINQLSSYLRKSGDIGFSAFEQKLIAGELAVKELALPAMRRLLMGVAAERVYSDELAEPGLVKIKYSSVHSTNVCDLSASKDLLKKIRSKLKEIGGSARRHNVSNELLSVWKDFVRADDHTVEGLLKASSALCQVMVAGMYYLTEVAKRKGKGSKQIQHTTIATYCSKVVTPLIDLHGETSFFTLKSDDYVQVYRDILEFRNTEQPGEGARRLRDFHETLENAFGLEKVDWNEVEPEIFTHKENVNANMITAAEYRRCYQFFHQSPALDPAQTRICSIVFILSFRMGLRIGEITNLKVRDVNFHDQVLFVRSNNLRTVKSTNSNRRLPLTLFLNFEEISLLEEQVQMVRSFHPQNKNLPLFCSIADPHHAIDLSFYVEQVKQVLRHVTGDPSLNLHHGRHSFASYLYLLINRVNKRNLLKIQLNDWFRTDDLSHYREQFCRTMLGKNYPVETRELYAISCLLGHSTPEITLNHYVHIGEFIRLSACENWINFHVTSKSLANIGNLRAANARKLIERLNEAEGKGRVILENCLSKNTALQSQQDTNKQETINSDLTFVYSPSYLSQLFVFADGLLKAYFANGLNCFRGQFPLEAQLKLEITSIFDELIVNQNVFGFPDEHTGVEYININEGSINKYIFNAEFKQVCSQVIKLWNSENELISSAIKEWEKGLYQSGIVLFNEKESDIIRLGEMLSLHVNLTPLSKKQSRWIKNKNGKLFNVSLKKESKRGWNRKFNYLLLLIISVDKILGFRS